MVNTKCVNAMCTKCKYPVPYRRRNVQCVALKFTSVCNCSPQVNVKMVVVRAAAIWVKEKMLRWVVFTQFVPVSSSLQLLIETGMNVWNLTKAIVQQPSPPILIPYSVTVRWPSPPILPYFVKQVKKIQIKSRFYFYILTSEFCEWLLEGLEIRNTAKCPVTHLSLFKVWHKKYVLMSPREQHKRDCRWLFGWLQPCWCIVHLLPLIVNC